MNNDRIEREIFIKASVHTVWELVSRPAWWVGDKPYPDSVKVEGTRIVAETRFGTFPVLIKEIDPPNYLTCQWASSFPGEEPQEGNSTLVAFTLTEKEEGTLLRVVESGFSSLEVSEEEQSKFLDGNVNGWEQQMEVLRKRAEN